MAAETERPEWLRVLRSESAFADAAARAIVDAIRANPELSLCLPTGRSPVPVYRRLVAAVQSGHVSLSRARLFLVDEYVGAGPGDAWSFAATMRRNLIDHVDLSPSRVYLIDACADDPHEAARRYEAEIRAAGGLDLAVLGLGANGHVAFNEPGTAVDSQTHVAVLTPATLAANAPDLPQDQRPDRAITIGLATIRAARRILLLAAGARKEAALRALLEGADPARWPVAALNGHPGLAVIATAEVLGRRGAEDGRA